MIEEKRQVVGIKPSIGALIICTFLNSPSANAQNEDAAAAMARKAQDPLGNVKALMTDNTIAFDGGPNDDTTYVFQFQPVYAIENNTRFNMLARAIIPVIGVEPGVVLPPLGPEPRPDSDNDWSMSAGRGMAG